MEARGHVFKYGDNVDTDVIIPAISERDTFSTGILSGTNSPPSSESPCKIASEAVSMTFSFLVLL